jgi:TonB family protein
MDMNLASLYRQNSRSIFWIAFISALAIHIGAVALPKTKSPTGKPEDFNPASEVDLVDTGEPEARLVTESSTPPLLEQIRPDEDSFQDENLVPPRVRVHQEARPTSFGTATTASFRSAKAMLAYAPRPIYPYEAHRQRITGSGVALLTIDQSLGNVTGVLMTQSCGNAILDNSTLDALRRWRFKPGTVVRVRVPITYTLLGVSY